MAMVMRVLQDKLQISRARQELVHKGISVVDSQLQSVMRRFGLLAGVKVGDVLKSWDVLATIDFLESHLEKTDPVLDIGCYASEVIVALHKLGFSNLTGVDINPDLIRMPYRNLINYKVCDFMTMPFGDASFMAVTSISVIEHGLDVTSLFKEMSRVLRTNGYFIASFDYWPDKIDTTGEKIFGMDWNIFSKDEIQYFVTEAEKYGLFPVGDLNYDASLNLIDYSKKKYTFAWLVLEKR
jgi:ubiquinone/menaquinone biosynthesis C-methylase UbiE